MAVIEVVEELRQLECMLGRVGWFGSGNALVDDGGGLRRRQPDFPDFVSRFALEIPVEIDGGSEHLLRSDSGFAEDVGRPHDGVLSLGSGFAFEAESFFEVEGDDRRLGELQHEVAQGAHGDIGSDPGAF